MMRFSCVRHIGFFLFSIIIGMTVPGLIHQECAAQDAAGKTAAPGSIYGAVKLNDSGTVTNLQGATVNVNTSPPRSTVTDASGGFQFIAVPVPDFGTMNYLVEVVPNPPDWEGGSQTVTVPCSGFASVTITVEKPAGSNNGSIVGTVTDFNTEEPIDGATVTLVLYFYNDTVVATTTTDANGDYHFDDVEPTGGEYSGYKIIFEHDGHETYESDLVGVGEGETVRVDAALPESDPEGITVFGIVTDDNGDPVAGVTVTVNGHSTVTDDKGRYVLNFNEPDFGATPIYTLTAMKDGYEYASSGKETMDEVIRWDVTITENADTGGFSGAVYNLDAAVPMAMEEVTTTGGHTTWTDDQGHYSFRGLPPGEYTADIHWQETFYHCKRNATVIAGQMDTNVDIVKFSPDLGSTEETACIIGHIFSGGDNTPVPDALISVRPNTAEKYAAETPPPAYAANTDANGYFGIPDLPPGDTWSVFILCPGYTGDELTGLTLTTGEATWAGLSVEPSTLASPTDLVVADTPDDYGHSCTLSWSLSPDDASLTHYYIFRSRSSEFNAPLDIDAIASFDDLLAAEQDRTILIGTVQAGLTTYTDDALTFNNTDYFYWVSGVDGSGSASKPAFGGMRTAVATADEPAGFGIVGNYPNPFNPSTTVAFTLDRPGRAVVSIYNVKGQRVRILLDRSLAAGGHEVLWDGRDDRGVTVSSGMYMGSVRSGARRATHAMMLVK